MLPINDVTRFNDCEKALLYLLLGEVLKAKDSIFIFLFLFKITQNFSQIDFAPTE